MWSLYSTASKFGQRPSSLIPEITDTWAALQFDNAVGLVGMVLDNARQEMHKVGDEWKQKYTMKQLLDPTFALGAGEELDTSSLRGIEGIAFDEVVS